MNRTYPEIILEKLTSNLIPYHTDLPEKLAAYLNLIIQWNQVMNLTTVQEPLEIIDRHFMDSLAILRSVRFGEGIRLIDVGTGAGFPGMVLAMALPGIRVTLLDSLQKRIGFLREVSLATDTAVDLIHARAEDAARDPSLREQFDAATSRALAPTNILCEYMVPFLKVGGYAYCWKGPVVDQEMKEGESAAAMTGGAPGGMIPCTIAGTDWDHRILLIKKVKYTPKDYPRKPAIIRKVPLGTENP